MQSLTRQTQTPVWEAAPLRSNLNQYQLQCHSVDLEIKIMSSPLSYTCGQKTSHIHHTQEVQGENNTHLPLPVKETVWLYSSLGYGVEGGGCFYRNHMFLGMTGDCWVSVNVASSLTAASSSPIRTLWLALSLIVLLVFPRKLKEFRHFFPPSKHAETLEPSCTSRLPSYKFPITHKYFHGTP